METNSWNDTMSSVIINNITTLPSVISTPVSKILNEITTTEMTNFNNQTTNANNTSTDLFETKKDIWTNIKNYLTNFYESDYFWPTTGFISYGLITTSIIIGYCIYNWKINNNKKNLLKEFEKEAINSIELANQPSTSGYNNRAFFA